MAGGAGTMAGSTPVLPTYTSPWLSTASDPGCSGVLVAAPATIGVVPLAAWVPFPAKTERLWVVRSTLSTTWYSSSARYIELPEMTRPKGLPMGVEVAGPACCWPETPVPTTTERLALDWPGLVTSSITWLP